MIGVVKLSNGPKVQLLYSTNITSKIYFQLVGKRL